MTENKLDTWSIFHECFKVGDDVVLIDDEDRVFCGKLKSFDAGGCHIRRPGWKVMTEVHFWKDIEFMSHDGFPVRKLLGADGSESILSWHKEDIRGKIIKILDGSRLHRVEPLKRIRIARGDPFLIEGVTGRLFNVGNHGPQWWDSYFEECLCLTAPDGAKALLYDLKNVYHFEVENGTI